MTILLPEDESDSSLRAKVPCLTLPALSNFSPDVREKKKNMMDFFVFSETYRNREFH